MEHPTWHALPVSAVATRLETDPRQGLSPIEAGNRLKKGRNVLPEPHTDTFLRRLVRQFASPIALVLLVAAIATALVSHPTDALVILAALLVNVIMGLVQEGRASRAFDALKKSEARYAIVTREGEPAKISAEELVPGDHVTLMTGAAVPADLRLVETHALTINESALSGEWVPVEKSIIEVAEGAPLVERGNMAYSGTLVVSGAGKGIVIATGKDTELGGIAAELAKERTTETPLMRDIKGVARLLVIIAAGILIAIAFLGFFRDLPFGEVLFMAIALAVASVPEGLPAAVTVVLALGMERILKSGGLVRNLLAAETLGTTSIILTDKTGTLTMGRMMLESFVTYAGTSQDANEDAPRRLLTGAVLASDAYVEERPDAGDEEKLVAHGRPIEQAVVLAGLKVGVSQRTCLSERPRIDELHFDSSRRFGGMLVKEEGKQVAYITGAPELLLTHVRRIEDEKGKVHALSGAYEDKLANALSEATRNGKRVVAVARIETKEEGFPPEGKLEAFLDEGALLGLLVFSDTIRPEVHQAIADIKSAGARVLMLTGDNPETALSIAREVGIAGPDDRAYTGAELSALSDDELVQVLRTNVVFARVAPAEKLRIAEVLQAAGEVVAMTGDGVNDAPALRAAGIGVAVGSGTDVAKEAADLVLLENSFSVITAAIREGRRLRDNFKKIFAYMLSTNFSEVVLIGVALFVGLPLPILPTQILWSNLIEGGLMNFAFAFEPLYPSAMKRKPQDPDIAKVLSGKLIALIALVGTVTASFLLAAYLYLISLDIPLERIQTLMFVGVSVSSIFMAFSMKSFGTPLWRLPLFSNRFLMVSLAASLFFLMLALYAPPVQMLVHTVSPTPLELGLFIVFGILNLATIELAKWLVFILPERRRA